MENVPILDIVKAVGTPCYVYSYSALVANWLAFSNAFSTHPHSIFYAVKANSNLALLNIFSHLGAGFDIVSEGELARIEKICGYSAPIVFSGVGKTESEIARALKHNLFCLNVESEEELYLAHAIAQRIGKKIPIALRINPNVKTPNHPFICTGSEENKFGIPMEQAIPLYKKAKTLPFFILKGIACHIGSQCTTLPPFTEALSKLLYLVEKLKQENIVLSHVNIGGGLGVQYGKEDTAPTIEAYAQALLSILPPSLRLLLEPGRILTANAGLLISKVLYTKSTPQKNFCIVDAGMNDFIRPALYNAWHNIVPVSRSCNLPTRLFDVVGPVCESTDFFGHARPLAVKMGDYIAVCDVGAYGLNLSAQYPSRPKACEVLVKAQNFKVVRKRETFEQLYELENLW